MLYKGLPVYVLSIKNFVLKLGKDESVYVKQWKNAPFSVDKSFEDDFALDADFAHDNDDIYNFDF